MKKLVLTIALAAALAPAAAGQDGGGPAPAPGPAPAGPTPPPPPPQEPPAPQPPPSQPPTPQPPGQQPPGQQRKPVKDPSKAVATRIEEALKGVFSTSAADASARASLDAAIAEWEADAKESPLRAVKWWKGMLAGTLPTTVRHGGIVAEKVAYLEGREATVWVSTPKSYGPKGIFPLVLVLLDKGEDPRRALPAMYGDILKDWIVVAIVADPKEAGLDVVREPWLAAVGLKFAVENLRVDRDRVVFDASASNSNIALALGSEWAVQFAGVVLRAPTASNPLLSNLALGSVLLLDPEAPSEAQKKAAAEVKASVPDAAVAVTGKGDAEAVQKWIAAVPPRRVSSAEASSYGWKRRAQGGEPWAYWLWVVRAADQKEDRLVSATVTRDAAGSVVDLQTDNLAEGILLLNDDFLDLDRDVTVRVNGKEVWKGRVDRMMKKALQWMLQTGERSLFVPGEIRFTVPADVQLPKKDGAGAGAPPADGAPPPPPPPPPPHGGDKGGGDKPGGDKPGGEKPGGDKPGGDKDGGDKGGGDAGGKGGG